ncbi:MAG: hypothetical protein H6706_03030 [Myxococcales bacterium]|nr:hypothetical protein [Myxococcales bacterium]
MQVRGFALAAFCALWACDDGGGEDPPVREDFGTVDEGMGGAGGAGGEGGGGETETRLRLSYIKAFTPPNAPARQDLVVYDFTDREAFNLTADGGVDCNSKTCLLNGDMTWVGWMERADNGGFSLWVAPVDVKRKLVKAAEKRRVDDGVNAFDFTTSEGTNLIIYTRGQAIGTERTIEVLVEPVAGADAACPLDDTPERCQQFVGTINADGGFRVTPFGSLIIVIKTTLSTMTLDFFNVKNGANQTLYTFGEQGGTGSQFSGRLPVALSPDATYLAVFTRNDFIWRAQTLQAIPSPPPPRGKDLFETETNQDGDCRRQMPYNFNEVRFNPVFSADGGFFYFLAKGDCTKSAGESNRDDYDIMRFDRDLSADPVNITNNIRASHWSNHDIGDFALDPAGERLAFTASRPNNAASRSIWIINPADGTYDCSEGTKQHSDLNGDPRCEYIYDDAQGATVSFRDLRFHQVEVPR